LALLLLALCIAMSSKAAENWQIALFHQPQNQRLKESAPDLP
jgi:hypothetical protein